jgi:chemotaxis protein MotA
MFAIIGIFVVFAAIIGGFLMEKGQMAVLVQPAELLIIAGAAAGTLLIANPMRIVKAIAGGLAGTLKGSPFTKERYLNTLKMLYQFLNKVRKEGLLAVEMDVEKPEESAIFKNFPEFLNDHHARDFVCDTLRTAITGGVEPFDMDQMMELDMEVHHHEAVQPVDSLTTVADSLPGLGIVAAVLGVVITMGALGGPPEEIGKTRGRGAGGDVSRHPALLRRGGTAGRQHGQAGRRAQRVSARAAGAAAGVSERLGADDRHRNGTPRDSGARPAGVR